MKKSIVLANEEKWGYIFIAPQIVGILAFTIVPVIQSLGISFTRWDIVSPSVFVGLINYKTVLTSPNTWRVLMHTLSFISGYSVLTIFFSLLIALVLSNNRIRGYVVYRTAFFLPNITSSVAVSLVWLGLFNPDLGLVNILLRTIGILNPPGWYISLEWAMPTIVLMAVWMGVGYNMIIFIAGLNGISDTYYEAASIDGAGPIFCFLKITLPLLTPTIFFVITTMLIWGFQVFNEVYMLTNGGPVDSTKTIMLEIYNTAFRYFRMGEASVLAWLLFSIILVVTILQFSFSKKWVNYDV